MSFTRENNVFIRKSGRRVLEHQSAGGGIRLRVPAGHAGRVAGGRGDVREKEMDKNRKF